MASLSNQRAQRSLDVAILHDFKKIALEIRRLSKLMDRLYDDLMGKR